MFYEVCDIKLHTCQTEKHSYNFLKIIRIHIKLHASQTKNRF